MYITLQGNPVLQYKVTMYITIQKSEFGPYLGHCLYRNLNHVVRKNGPKFNLSPRDLGPSPLNAGQVWHLDLCVTLEV